MYVSLPKAIRGDRQVYLNFSGGAAAEAELVTYCIAKTIGTTLPDVDSIDV